jgi:hypothetical protein
MANEYIFFDESLSQRFAQFAAERGIASEIRPDAIDGFVVALPDNLGDDLDDDLEETYDALMDEQRQLVEADEDEDSKHLMGVTVTLPDGQSCLVRLPPEFGHRLLETFSPQEIHALITAIAAEVANPISGPLCRNA